MKGELFAIACAGSWAVAVIFFKRSGEKMSPLALNLFKNVVGLLLFALTMYVMNDARIFEIPRREIVILILSGVIGIGLADTIFFRSLQILGASWSSIVDCFYSPSVIFFSFLILGEHLHATALLGASLIVAAVLLAGLDREALRRRADRFVRGVILGAISMALMAVSIVYVKPILDVHPILATTTLRLIGGMATAALYALIRADRKNTYRAFVPQSSWRFALPGAFFGTYVSLIFWIGGFKYTQAGIAGVLNQTSTLFVVVLAAIFLREPLTRWKVAAVVLALAGSTLVVM